MELVGCWTLLFGKVKRLVILFLFQRNVVLLFEMLLYGLCDFVRHLCSSNDFHVFVFEQKISTFGNSDSDLFKVVVRLGPDLQTTGTILQTFSSPVCHVLLHQFLTHWMHGAFCIYIYIYTVSPHCIYYPLLGPIKINHPTSQFTNLPTVYLYPQ